MYEAYAKIGNSTSRRERSRKHHRLKPTWQRQMTYAFGALQEQLTFRKNLFPENPRYFRHSPPATVPESSAGPQALPPITAHV
jgi:hypothetical protein